jgi:hypothetical protein
VRSKQQYVARNFLVPHRGASKFKEPQMQISVVLPDEVLTFVQRAAERDCRTVSAQLRYYATEAARRAGGAAAGLTAWPPELPTVTPGNLSAIKAHVAELRQEYERLRAIERKSPLGLLPDQDERLRFCRDRIDQLNRQIGPMERMQGMRNG